jgi:tetratricopeptide (TPR) repeat protein
MGASDEALKCFRVAGSCWRSSDAPYFAQATVIKLTLQQISKGDFAVRKTEFERAETLLSEAERRNPLRPEIFHMRGLLYLENRDLAGPNGMEKAAANFEKALKLNPLFYHARVAYASLLGKAGKEQEALKVLKDGLHYTYTLNADILPYFKMSARVLERFADYENLKGLPEKIKSIEKNS